MREHLRPKFGDSWYIQLAPFLTSKHFSDIGLQLNAEVAEGKKITPLLDDTFRAFKECPFDDVKVVILGLDPYPGDGVADGLAFSARNHKDKEPKSLSYILGAVERDVYDGFAIPFNEEWWNPDLTRWAKQGVLLLNTALSTHVGKTGVHLELWRPFIKYVLNTLSMTRTNVVYILLGAKAKEWRVCIDAQRNKILEASHPASCAYKGLKEWDCNKVFSTANAFLLEKYGKEGTIVW